jgi:peroxiredoxin
LGQLQEVESEIKDMGYRIIAASADRPDKLSGTADEEQLTYLLVSDSKQSAAKAFGLAFQVGDQTLQRFKGFGKLLEEASGETHHILPVPAVYLIGKDGIIDFTYVNPDYKVRLEPQILLAAARAHAD